MQDAMAQETPDGIDLNRTDLLALRELRRGRRASPSFVANEHDYTRQNVRNRLGRLSEHEYVVRLYKGLYELAEYDDIVAASMRDELEEHDYDYEEIEEIVSILVDVLNRDEVPPRLLA